MKRKVSLKWYISKLNHVLVVLPFQMSTTDLTTLCNNNNNNNNNYIPTETDDNCKQKQESTQVRKKLLTKLGKLNVSKSSEEETTQPQPQPEHRRDKSTEYYYKHREEKLEYQKNYNRQKGDEIKDYNKNYYMKRREEILEKARTKVTCECGCVVQLFNMNSHKKTKKHVRYLEMRQAMVNASTSQTENIELNC